MTAPSPAPVWTAPHPSYQQPPRFGATRRRRTRMWVALTVTVVLAVAGGATAVALVVVGDDEPAAAPPPATASLAPTRAAPPPRQPGLEPPRAGDWPRWPTFTPTAGVREQVLDGTGLTLTLPGSWTCALAASDEGTVRHTCGAQLGGGDELGGEITVRICVKPCNGERRTAMRQAEEAWAQQWRFAGDYVVIAETRTVNGTARYGLVLVAFWRSVPDDAIDRQLVLRMTAPEAWVDEIRRVANATRDAVGF